MDLVYDLDQETGMPLTLSCFENEAKRNADLPAFVWTVTSFEKVDSSRYFPMKSNLKTYATEDGKATVRSEREIRVMEVKFNGEYPAAMFAPETRPEDTVWEEIENVRKNFQTPTSTTIRVEAPSDTTRWAVWAALVVGIMAIAAGLYLRRQQTRAA